MAPTQFALLKEAAEVQLDQTPPFTLQPSRRPVGISPIQNRFNASINDVQHQVRAMLHRRHLINTVKFPNYLARLRVRLKHTKTAEPKHSIQDSPAVTVDRVEIKIRHEPKLSVTDNRSAQTRYSAKCEMRDGKGLLRGLESRPLACRRYRILDHWRLEEARRPRDHDGDRGDDQARDHRR
jgi:hypothetical protein